MKIGSAEEPASRVEVYPWYVVTICMVAFIFSFIDRQILTLLIEPIQKDLGLSDTQFGLLHGFAFALFYVIVGIPLARLADQKSRPLIIVVGIVVWSIATVLCGMAKTFWQFFLARICVGAGESALSPSVYSMLSDYFPKEKLGRAVGIYASGSFIGSGLAFLIGAAVVDVVAGMDTYIIPVIGEIKPWQLTFFIVGIPGILVALLMWLTVKDPERKGMALNARGGIDAVSFGKAIRYVWKYKGPFATVYSGFTLAGMALFVVMSWTPAYYIRIHEMKMEDVGYYLGIIILLANTTGVFFSGWLTDYFTRKGEKDSALIVGALAGVGLVVPACLYTLVGDKTLSIILLVPTLFFAAFPISTSTVSMQLLAPNQMRAQVMAFFLFFNNLIGFGAGVALVGVLNDYLFKDPMAVRYTIPIVAGTAAFLSAVILQAGRKSYLQALKEREG